MNITNFFTIPSYRATFRAVGIALLLSVLCLLYFHQPPLLTLLASFIAGWLLFSLYYLSVSRAKLWGIVYIIAFMACLISISIQDIPLERLQYSSTIYCAFLIALYCFRKPFLLSWYQSPSSATRRLIELNKPLSSYQQRKISRLSTGQLAEIDAMLLQQCAKEWQTLRSIVGKTQIALDGKFDQLPSSFFAKRLQELASASQLEKLTNQGAFNEVMLRRVAG